MELSAEKSALSNDLESGTNILNQFKSDLETFTSLASEIGYKLVPYTSRSIQKFNSLSSDRKHQTTQIFCSYLDILLSVKANGGNLRDDRTLLWYAIKKMKLRPTSDLMDKIGGDDIVEVYNSDFIQIFRNFNFFDISSYAVADIFLYEWRDLYRRENGITNKIVTLAINLFKGRYRSTIESDVESHYLEEVFSSSLHRMTMKQLYYSPLYSEDGSVGAVVATSRVLVTEVLKSETVE